MTARALLLAALAVALCVVAGCSRAEESPSSAPAPSCCETGVEPAPEPADEAARLGMPLEFTNDLGMRFVLIPGGTAPVGSPADEAGRSGDETRHDVRIIWSFYMATKTVDAAQWARGTEAAPVPSSPAGSAPATGMTFAEATSFARRLTERDPKWIYRLPTEAEWERAARAAGEARPLPAGPNAWGVEELADGVGEWCRDPYGPYPDWAVADPLHLEPAGDRVVRGLHRGAQARPAARAHVNPAAGRADVGLRLVARLSYGKADEGAATVVFRTVDTDASEEVVGVRSGYGIRIIAVADRLESRQHGVRPLPWVRLPVKGSPLTLHVPPGRYYAQCEVPGDGPPVRGIELKIDAVPGAEVHVDLPVPKPGGTLNDPE